MDGLRAIAAFCVISAHFSYWLKFPATKFYDELRFFMSFGGNLGRIGVICFFVLSGFLITYLMFVEQAKNGKLNILFFYVRRILRIWPLYFLTLIIGFVIYPLILHYKGLPYHENASWVMYVLFAANFDHIYHYFPTSNMLGVQWSVAVEEQFYLLWPMVFLFLNKKNFFPFLLILIVICSEAYSIQRGTHIAGGDYHFLSCIRYLSFGSFLAYLCYNRTEMVVSFLKKIKRFAIFGIYILCITLMILQNYITSNFDAYKYMYHLVPVLFFGFLILEQNYSDHSFFKIGNSKILNWLGKISYGLYLTHLIALNIVISVIPIPEEYVFFNILLALGLTFLISHVSYFYFERYFLKMKDKFSFNLQ